MVFDKYEKISVGSSQIVEVVNELQDYRLVADEKNQSQWDLMGAAYEEYTSTYLKKTKGQYFTNRLIVDLLVRMVNPKHDDIILDPAGGSGGFVTTSLRYLLNNVRHSNRTEQAKRRIIDAIRANIFMVEIARPLVKVAKTAMVLNGDGHTGITQGNSLGDLEFKNAIDDALISIADYKRTTICNKTKIVYNPKEPIYIQADRDRISQVIYNLLNNAIKFTEGGTILIDAQNNIDSVIVLVKDTEIGIAPEIQPKLYSKFATNSCQGLNIVSSRPQDSRAIWEMIH